MFRSQWVVLVLLGIGLGGPHGLDRARGDEFERIEGEALAGVARSKEATAHRQLAVGAIDALPNVLRESRSALLLATTDQGNLTRMLVFPALRRAPGSTRDPVPVLVIERLDTFDAGNVTTRLARGKDVILFDGFLVDLDSGQIVPEDQGGDLQFRVRGEGGPRLMVQGKAMLYTVTKAPLLESATAARPSIGRTVLPGDFTGRYRLFANGQWSGTLDLKVDGGGGVSGRFRSDLNGAAYPVNGQVAPDVPHKISFAVKFPRTLQDYEGFLWAEGKGAMAGTLSMLDHVYGFFAIREGARFAPEGEDVGPLAKDREASAPGRQTVVVRKGQYTLDGQPRTDQELTDALKRAMTAEPTTWVLLQVAAAEPYAAIQQAFEVISTSGVRTIRLAAAD